MKLWIISQEQTDGYDTYDSAVVAANTEDAARRTCPGGSYEYNAEGILCYSYGEKEPVNYPSWATDLDRVKVELIGKAEPNIKAGVICASFNAG